MGKSGALTLEEQQAYDDINSKVDIQREQFRTWIEKIMTQEARDALVSRSKNLGFRLNLQQGTLSYASDFQPLTLPYELCYVRHGKTEGNTEPRVYQGQVDYPDNQLNAIGRQQAEEAADKMDKELPTWRPDIIVYSPLQRAIDTGAAFAKRHPEIPCVILNQTAEMAFGNWDGERVIDVDHSSFAHLFYIDQNAIVVAAKPHRVRGDWCNNGRREGETIAPENFIDLLDRMKQSLFDIGDLPQVRAVVAAGRKPKVLMYGHSMAGAAVSMLLGHGKRMAGSDDLGFDGAHIMPNATPTHLRPQNPPLCS